MARQWRHVKRERRKGKGGKGEGRGRERERTGSEGLDMFLEVDLPVPAVTMCITNHPAESFN